MLHDAADIVDEYGCELNAVDGVVVDHYSVAKKSILRARKRMTRAMIEIVRATEELTKCTGIPRHPSC
jgi:hypothetical protein